MLVRRDPPPDFEEKRMPLDALKPHSVSGGERRLVLGVHVAKGLRQAIFDVASTHARLFRRAVATQRRKAAERRKRLQQVATM
jgi:hypothetical protein